MKNGWHKIKGSLSNGNTITYDVFVENNLIKECKKPDGTSAFVYRWDSKQNVFSSCNHYVNVNTFRSGNYIIH